MNNLDSNQIKEYMKDKKGFLGVYSENEFPSANERRGRKRIAMCFNLEKSNEPGSHWVSVLVDRGGVYYIDSFGQPPPIELYNNLRKVARSDGRSYSLREIFYNEKDLQAINSSRCGYYAILISRLFLSGEEPDTILKLFTSPQENETLLKLVFGTK